MLNFLLLDDDSNYLDLLAQALKFLPDEVHIYTATNIADATKIADNNHIDLFIMDLFLKNESGIEMAKTLQSSDKYQETPKIMISGAADDEHREQAVSVGICLFLDKPIDLAVLFSAVRNILLL